METLIGVKHQEFDDLEHLAVQIPFINIDLIPFIDFNFSFAGFIQKSIQFFFWLKNLTIWLSLFAAGAPTIVVLILLPLVLLVALSIAAVFVTPLVAITPYLVIHYIFLPATWPLWLLTYDAACGTDTDPPN